MSNVVNERIRSWLDSGHAVNVLLGTDRFFIPSVSFREEHDRILAIDQLMGWAFDTNQTQAAADALHAAVNRTITSGDIERAVDLLLAYFIVAGDRGDHLPLDHRRLLGDLLAPSAVATSPDLEASLADVRSRLA
jgi:hypothetical protein